MGVSELIRQAKKSGIADLIIEDNSIEVIASYDRTANQSRHG